MKKMMRILVVLNRKPYDGTDLIWNALRLILQAQKSGMEVKIFLMNDAVELARVGLKRGEEFDLPGMLVEAIAQGAEARLCKTCLARRGIAEKEVKAEVKIAVLPDLVEWIAASDRVLTF